MQDFIIDAIVEWLKGLLVDGIMGNLDGLFDNVNQSVGEIATHKMDEFYNLIITYIERLNSIATRYEQTERTNTEIASNRTY